MYGDGDGSGIPSGTKKRDVSMIGCSAVVEVETSDYVTGVTAATADCRVPLYLYRGGRYQVSIK